MYEMPTKIWANIHNEWQKKPSVPQAWEAPYVLQSEVTKMVNNAYKNGLKYGLEYNDSSDQLTKVRKITEQLARICSNWNLGEITSANGEIEGFG